MQKELKTVPANKIHQSAILPPREHGTEISDSVKKTGLQTAIIVRLIQQKPDEYEVIDGSGRLEALRGDDEVLVDVRCVTDAQVFAISNSTFQRKDRTAYEVSQFYAAWLKVLEKEKGQVEGLQQELADQANLSESSLSQFIAIARLFDKLQQVAPKEPFEKLKTWSINKLYKLSELVDDDRLIDAARFFDMKFETSPEEVAESVADYRRENMGRNNHRPAELRLWTSTIIRISCAPSNEFLSWTQEYLPQKRQESRFAGCRNA